MLRNLEASPVGQSGKQTHMSGVMKKNPQTITRPMRNIATYLTVIRPRTDIYMNMITETMNPEHHMAVAEITNGGKIANRDGNIYRPRIRLPTEM